MADDVERNVEQDAHHSSDRTTDHGVHKEDGLNVSRQRDVNDVDQQDEQRPVGKSVPHHPLDGPGDTVRAGVRSARLAVDWP